MINLVKLEDKELIQTALAKDEIYKQVAGAYIDPDFDPQLKNTSWYLGIRDGQVIGLCYLTVFTSNCICFHCGLYKEFRGKDTVQILKETIKAVKKITPQTIIFTIASNNDAAKKVAIKAGYIYKTTIKNGNKTGSVDIYAEE